MVVSVEATSSTTRKAASRSTRLATAKISNKNIPGPATYTETPRKSSRKKSTKQDAKENVLFAAVPAGFREQYVPNPSNPKLKSSGRLMIPFYPIGEGKQNGNGLPMAYCLALQGLKDPLAPVFTQEVEAGKTFVSFMLTWPGYYPQLNRHVKISVFGATGSVLTRRELAWIIADHYRLFFEACCTDASLKTSEPAWRIGSRGFTFDDVRLAGCWTSGEDVWHASVMVLTPIDLDAWARAGMVLTLPQTQPAALTLPLLPISNDLECFNSGAGETESDELQFDTEWETPCHGEWGDDEDFVI